MVPGSMIFQADFRIHQCQSLIKDVSKHGADHTLVNNAGITKDQIPSRKLKILII